MYVTGLLNRLRWWGMRFLVCAVLMVTACSYDRQEHYPLALTKVRLVLTQALDEQGRPLTDSKTISIDRRSLYADVWVYEVMPGQHMLTCRLFSTQGQIRDVQDVSAVVAAGKPLHRFCTFSLSPFDSAGYWSMDILLDGVQVLHRKLEVSH